MPQRKLKMSDNVSRKLRDIAKSMGGGSVSIGFLEGAIYPNGTPVASVAFWNEFGTQGGEHTPPRPFFRGMISKESPSWPGKMAKLAKVTNYDGEKVLTLMGADIEGSLKKSINDFTSPALAPSTIRRKGFAKPLMATSHMVNSTGYEFKK